jgi:hypothetical protein
MSRKLKCPACGSEISLEQLEQTADLEALSEAEGAYGDDWPLIREYLDCFRPASGKALTVQKRLRLAREVWGMWRPGRFVSNRQEYEVGREEFKEALRITCNQVSPPLSNHNYLKKVLVKAAEQTSKRRERELRDNEEQLRSGLRRTGETPALPDDPEWRAKLAELGKAVRRAKTPEAKAEASRRYAEHIKEAGA